MKILKKEIKKERKRPCEGNGKSYLVVSEQQPWGAWTWKGDAECLNFKNGEQERECNDEDGIGKRSEEGEYEKTVLFEFCTSSFLSINLSFYFPTGTLRSPPYIGANFSNSISN